MAAARAMKRIIMWMLSPWRVRATCPLRMRRSLQVWKIDSMRLGCPGKHFRWREQLCIKEPFIELVDHR